MMGTIKERDMTVKTIVRDGKEYERKTIAARAKISTAIADRQIDISLIERDLMEEVYTAILKGHIYSRKEASTEIHVNLNPPNFLDWLLRRKRTFVFEVELSEMLTDVMDDVLRTVEIKHVK